MEFILTNVGTAIGTMALSYPIWYLLFKKKVTFPPSIAAPEGYVIETMKREDYDTCVKLAAKCFSENNPGVVHLGITAEEWTALTVNDTQIENCVDTNLSLVCKRKADNKIGAFLFCKRQDISHTIPNYKDLFKKQKAFQYFAHALETLYEGAISPFGGIGVGSLINGTCLHAAMGGTDKTVGRKGLAKCLRRAALDVALKNGFTTVLVEAGHPGTTHIWTKYVKAKEVATLWFDKYKAPDGTYPTKGVEDRIALCEFRVHDTFSDSALMWPIQLARLILTGASYEYDWGDK